jgi:hypothetical protein
MKKNDTKKPVVVSNKNDIDLRVEKIKSNLDDAQSGKIKNLSSKLKLVEDFYQLNLLGGLNLNEFMKHFKINSLSSLNWKDKSQNNIRFKVFVDLALIPSLNISKDEMQENEPYKYEALRDIAEIVITNILEKFLYYHQEVDAQGKITKTCFTVPETSKPVKIYVKSSLINNFPDRKKRFNSGGSGLIGLSFEKLNSFCQILLTGTAERVTADKDPTVTKSSKKLDEIKNELVANIPILRVDFNKKTPDGKFDAKGIELEKKQRSLQVDNLFQLVTSSVDKLIKDAEFDIVRNILLFIMNNENFSKHIKDNYLTSFQVVENLGGQLQKIDVEDLDFTSTNKLVQSRLKFKQ